MPTIKLTKVNIGPTRYIVYQDGVPSEVSTSVFMVVDIDGNTIYNYSEWSKQIGFATPTKTLLDKQYATQENGYHWVKIAGYSTIKIPPEHIVNGTLSQAGIDYIKTWSGVE